MKTKLLTLVVLLFTSFSLMAQITGTVKNSSTLSPIGNQTVYLTGDSLSGINMTTTTNSSGQFSFTNVGSSNYYDVHTYDCNQSYVGQTITSFNTVVNLLICTSGGNPTNCTSIFTFFTDSVNANLIHFNDLSTGNPVSWAWDFGDGTSSTLQNPSHLYSSNGNFTVALTITTANCTNTSSQIITVGNSTTCQSAFTYTISTSNTLTVQFNDVSTGNPSSWLWNFGDGITSTLQNPNHTYATNGTYTVSLAITTTNCTSTSNQTISVGSSSACQSAFTFNSNPANGLIIQFTDASTGSPTSWAWDFGDGTTSTQQNPSHTYTAGTYNVTLLIFGTNCQSSSTQSITVSSGSGSNFSVSGTVTAGNNNLDYGIVKLYQTSGSLVASAPVGSNGAYTFSNIAQGSYLLYAIPASNSTYNLTYAPTYYTSDILWTGATTLTVNANQTGKNIALVQIVPMNGTGSISGNLDTGSKTAVSGAVVNLLNNSTPVSSVITSTNGNYIFGNLANGTYTIWAEIAGKTTTPIIVTIDVANPNSINNDFIVKPNAVVPKAVSIDDAKKSLNIKTYPNPVENNLNIALSLENSSRVNVEVFNLTGQLLISNVYDLQSGSQTLRVNLNQLAKGSYILKISDNNNAHTQQLITKIR